MNHKSQLMVFAAVACFAINGVATTNGAFGQFTLDMAEQTPAKSNESKAADPASKPLSAPLLRGGTVEQSSPLMILQRRGQSPQSSQFDAELRRRTPLIDSSTYGNLQAEFDRGPSLQGELGNTNWLLPQSTIHTSPLFPPSMIPESPLVPPSMLPGSPMLQGRLFDIEPYGLPAWGARQPLWDPYVQSPPPPVLGVRSPSLAPRKAVQISDEIESQLSRLRKRNAASSEIEASLRGSPLQSMAEIDGQLLRANRRQAIPDIDGLIRAQQAVAKPLLDKQSAIASTQIKAVFRRVEQPSVDLETDARLRIGRDSDSLISWDAWYARVAKLSEPLLVRDVEGARGPGGANTVSITVRANHHLTVSLIDGGNPAFNAAVMRAYRSLDGNPALAFPAGSRRTEVTFLVDNNHLAPGDVSGVSTQSCKGDTERPRRP